MLFYTASGELIENSERQENMSVWKSMRILGGAGSSS